MAEPCPGIDIIGEMEVTVDCDGMQPYEWKDYGLRMFVPKGAFPTGAEGTIAIKASLSGQFQLPSRCDLVSAVYKIDANTDHLTPVTIDIQHCAFPNDISSLSFASVETSKGSLPYEFELEKGGVFTAHSSYGSMYVEKLRMTLLLAVVRSASKLLRKRSLHYCVQLFYICKQPTDWRIHLVMSRDLEVERKVFMLQVSIGLFHNGVTINL